MKLYRDYYQGWTLAFYAGEKYEFQIHGLKQFSHMDCGDIRWMTFACFTLFEFPGELEP